MPDSENDPKDKSEDKTSSPQTDVAKAPKDVEVSPPEKEAEVEGSLFPSDVPKEVRSFMMAQMRQMGPVPHPIFEKITPEHISKLIETSDKDSERELKDTSQRRRYSLVFALMIAAVFVFLVIYLSTTDPELLKKPHRLPDRIRRRRGRRIRLQVHSRPRKINDRTSHNDYGWGQLGTTNNNTAQPQNNDVGLSAPGQVHFSPSRVCV